MWATSDPGQEHVRIKHCKAMDQEANLNNSQSMDKGNNGFSNKRKTKHKKEYDHNQPNNILMIIMNQNSNQT